MLSIPQSFYNLHIHIHPHTHLVSLFLRGFFGLHLQTLHLEFYDTLAKGLALFRPPSEFIELASNSLVFIKALHRLEEMLDLQCSLY